MHAASVAPPSGQSNCPSARAASSTAASVAASGTAMAKPPPSRTARRIMKSPIAFGTRIPDAIVCASSQRGACSWPRSHALTIAAPPGRDRMRVLPARRMLLAPLPRPDDRRAAVGLHRDHARPLRSDQPQRLELGKALPHPDQAGAAAGRIEDDVGHLPAELLGE